jgi:hypothetical protein
VDKYNQDGYRRLRQEIVCDIEKARHALANTSAEVGLDMERLPDLRTVISQLMIDLEISPIELAHVVARLTAVISVENILKNLEQVDHD